MCSEMKPTQKILPNKKKVPLLPPLKINAAPRNIQPEPPPKQDSLANPAQISKLPPRAPVGPPKKI
jgi:hypothetical protein